MANRCAHCGEEITDRDMRAPPSNLEMHYECGMRMALGSIAHLEQRCSCFVPGSDEGDPEDISRRDAARLVYAAVRSRGVLPPLLRTRA